MFGREDQRDVPARAWQRARAGQPCLVLVHGPSGTGKSGLVAQSMRELMDAGVP
ncbi:MAG: ATP-binding protein [Acidimicrobiales bacterium]